MRSKTLLLSLLTIALSPLCANAHFQALLPDGDSIDSPRREISLKILFTHPMERGPVMEMGQPKQFGVLRNGVKTDLLASLKPVKIDGKQAFECVLSQSEPADCVFYIEPSPYWEQAERKWIIHYAKVVVDAFGAESGWDSLVGLPLEIEPLTRPYSLYEGNCFQGIVRKDGKPVPFATVEVELFNEKGYAPASELHATQVLKADSNGVFTYAIPKAGWWGFAALVDGPKAKGPDGKDADTELGALIWVNAKPIFK